MKSISNKLEEYTANALAFIPKSNWHLIKDQTYFSLIKPLW